MKELLLNMVLLQNFQEICDFVRQRNTQSNQMRNNKYNQELDRRKKI